MAKGFLVLDKDGQIFATHVWGGEEQEHCPLAAPPGGQVISMTRDDVMFLVAFHNGGQKIVIKDQEVIVADVPIGKLSDGKLEHYADQES